MCGVGLSEKKVMSFLAFVLSCGPVENLIANFIWLSWSKRSRFFWRFLPDWYVEFASFLYTQPSLKVVEQKYMLAE